MCLFFSKVCQFNIHLSFFYWLTFKSPTEKFNNQLGKPRVYHDLLLAKRDVHLFMWWFEAPLLFHVPRCQSCEDCQKKASISFHLQWPDFAPSTIAFHPSLLTFAAKFSSQCFHQFNLPTYYISLPHLLFNTYILIQVHAFLSGYQSWIPVQAISNTITLYVRHPSLNVIFFLFFVHYFYI